jgi:hypothetical protein
MPISRPATKTKISTTEWGWPVTDLLNSLETQLAALAPTPWVAPTLQNGWVGYSWTPFYRKVGDVVQFRGTVNGGANGSIIMTLPVGFRPVQNHDFISYHWPGGAAACYVSVLTNGTLTASPLGGGAAVQYVSLSSVTFSITQ